MLNADKNSSVSVLSFAVPAEAGEIYSQVTVVNDTGITVAEGALEENEADEAEKTAGTEAAGDTEEAADAEITVDSEKNAVETYGNDAGTACGDDKKAKQKILRLTEKNMEIK